MTDSTTVTHVSDATTAIEPAPKRGIRGSVPGIVWTLLSLAFILFIVFGTVDARIWRFGQLRVESKSIARIWQVQAQNLPQVSYQWALDFLFYGALAVFVLCVIVGFRYLLDQSGDDIA